MNTEEMNLASETSRPLSRRQKRQTSAARRTSRGGREAGFTLLEIVIALLVMMIAVLATVSLFIFAVNYNTGSRDKTVALAIAQQRLEALRNLPFTDAALNATPATGTLTMVTNNGRTFAVTTTITNVDGAAPNPVNDTRRKVITVSVRPLGGRTTNGTNEWSFNPVTLATTRSSLKVGEYAQ